MPEFPWISTCSCLKEKCLSQRCGVWGVNKAKVPGSHKRDASWTSDVVVRCYLGHPHEIICTQVLALLLIPASWQQEAAGHGSSPLGPCHLHGNPIQSPSPPGFSLAQSWLLQAFEEQTSRWNISPLPLWNKRKLWNRIVSQCYAFFSPMSCVLCILRCLYPSHPR